MNLKHKRMDENSRFNSLSVKSGIIDHIWTSAVTVIFFSQICGVVAEAHNGTALIADTFNYLISNNINTSNVKEVYLELIVNRFGNNGLLTSSQIETLIDSLNHKTDISSSHESSEILCNYSSYSNARSCIQNVCLSPREILEVHNISADQITPDDLDTILPAVVYNLQQECSAFDSKEKENQSTKPSSGQVWGTGFLCVTLINLCALLGMVFIPLTNKSFYKRLLMFMVALGVGTLTGSSLLFLIPECFEMTVEDSPHYHDYIWKSTTVIGGIYMFFLVERILQSIMDKRKVSFPTHSHQKPRSKEYEGSNAGSVKLEPRTRHESMTMSFQMPEVREESASNHGQESPLVNNTTSNDSHFSTHPLVAKQHSQTNDVTASNGKHASRLSMTAEDVDEEKTNQEIKSVAWMVVFGDGVHNFIDGLSIGAAFTNSILAGVSVSIAVICEELPHELGDFAILLNSGMSMKQALLYNFLSACMCYLGLIIGIFVGELTGGSPWIFAIAGGMFLYISLVDMLPEVNHAAQEEVKETGNMWPPFLLQNAGLLTGYGIMIFLASFTSKIDFESIF